jgi:hypothetical protein
MEIIIRKKAMQVLESIAAYVDEINTAGAGDRWLDHFFNRIISYALPNVTYPKCSSRKLAARNYSCIRYRIWVIAFKIVKGRFVIYEIIHGSILK